MSWSSGEGRAPLSQHRVISVNATLVGFLQRRAHMTCKNPLTRNMRIAGLAIAAAASIVGCGGGMQTGNPGSAGASASGGSPPAPPAARPPEGVAARPPEPAAARRQELPAVARRQEPPAVARRPEPPAARSAGTSGGSSAGTSGGSSAGTSGGSSGGSTGGSSGGSTGGSSAGIGGRPPMPSCLADLIAPCPLGGACTFSRNASGNGDRYCYASGTKFSVVANSTCSAPTNSMATSTVRKPDGSICYTVETIWYYNSACEAGTITWKDAQGQVVATAATNISMTTVTCTGESAGTTCSVAWPTSIGCLDWPDGVVRGAPQDDRGGPRSDCNEGTCQ